jgi:hypothetical protein
MHWQHIFIPVLPNHLIDYLSAPMPFLIGVPAPIMQVSTERSNPATFWLATKKDRLLRDGSAEST